MDWFFPWRYVVAGIVDKKGGFREQDIYYHPHRVKKGCAWNDEHKVIDIISDYEDYDGHHESFSVDVVTMRICG